MKRLLLPLLSLIGFFSFGQEEKEIVFAFGHGKNYEIRIDGEDIFQTNKFNVAFGTHVIEIWNPGLEMVRDTINVTRLSSDLYRYTVKTSAEYTAYQENLVDYQRATFTYIAFPITMSIISGGLSAMFYARGKPLQRDLEVMVQTYPTSSSFSYLSDYEADFTQTRQQLNNNRFGLYASLGACAIATTCTVLGIRAFKKKFTKPKNNFFVSPFTGNDYSMYIDASATELKFGFKL